jgi:PAS domain S-box-containing protein
MEMMEGKAKRMLEVRHGDSDIAVAESIATLLAEASAITDYRTLRDTLPKRLAHLLKCRSILLYQKVGETLQFAAGTFDDSPDWSASLLAIAHINPIALDGDEPEALAWRTRTTVIIPSLRPTRVLAPLVYRQRCLGVLVAVRTEQLTHECEQPCLTSTWTQSEVHAVTAMTGVVALLLENTRLIERDRERIYALSQLTTVSSQMPYSLYEPERLKTLVVQRMREIARVDVCEMIDFSASHERVSWLAPELYDALAAYFHEQASALPLVIERPGDVNNPRSTELLRHVAPEISTFFAFPLLGTRPAQNTSRISHREYGDKHASNVLGVVVAGYRRAWKLRREDAMLIQVVVGQAGAVLENMHLVIEVVEARNQARKWLRQVLKDQRFQTFILESMPSGLITLDMQGHITTFNAAAETILGYSADDIMGKSLATLLNKHAIPHAQQEQSSYFAQASSLHKAALANVLTIGETQHGTLLLSSQQGEELVLDLNVQPLRDDHEQQVGALITFVDVTSVHRLEEEKRRLDRLAVLGEMSAGLAHEVRNPLASIKTSIQMLMDDLADEGTTESSPEQVARVEIAQESTSVMLKEVERLDTLVRDMLLFARPRQLHRVRCDLPALSDHVLQLLQVQYADASIQICRNYDSVPTLWVDTGQIEQVLLNLYANAMQAMPDGGILTITCHEINKQQRETSRWVELFVADTGGGIASKHLEDIFKPFFTTKAHGIGLGLPITRRFIEDHGGSLLVESEVGKGTTFTIRLPVITNIPLEEE